MDWRDAGERRFGRCSSAGDERSGAVSSSATLEDPRVADQKICERAKRDRDGVGEQIVHVALADHHFHQREVAEDGDGSVGEIEAEKTTEALAVTFCGSCSGWTAC